MSDLQNFIKQFHIVCGLNWGGGGAVRKFWKVENGAIIRKEMKELIL